jgi:hypothetical protein
MAEYKGTCIRRHRSSCFDICGSYIPLLFLVKCFTDWKMLVCFASSKLLLKYSNTSYGELLDIEVEYIGNTMYSTSRSSNLPPLVLLYLSGGTLLDLEVEYIGNTMKIIRETQTAPAFSRSFLHTLHFSTIASNKFLLLLVSSHSTL